MEGTPKAIEIKGIVRNATVIGTQDGQAEDLINLRFMDGSWRASGDGRLVHTMSGTQYTQLYVHTNVYHHLLGVAPDPNNNDAPTLWWFANIENDGVTFTPLTTPVAITTVEGDIWITQTGHLLTIIDESEEFTYLVYIASNQNYKQVNADVNGDDKKPKIYPFGVAHFSFANGDSVTKESVDLMSSRYWNGRDSINEDNLKADIVPSDVLLLAESAREGIREKNQFNQPFLVCAAVRLYDGSYAYASNPILLNPGAFLNYERLRTSTVRCVDTPLLHSDFHAGGGRQGYDLIRDRVGYEGSFDANYNSRNSGAITGSLMTVMNGGNSYRSKDGVNAIVYKGTFYSAKAVGKKLRMQIEDIAFIKANPEIFQSVCIFVTREIETIDYTYTEFKDTDLVIRKSANSVGDYYESLFNVGVKLPLHSKLYLTSQMKKENFFLLREYKLEELDSFLNGATVTVDLNPEIYPGLLKNLVQSDQLTVEAFLRDSYLPKVSYNYNGRLHIANYRTTPWRGYAIPNYYNVYGGGSGYSSSCNPYIWVYLNQSNYKMRDVLLFMALWEMPLAYVKITSRNTDGSTRVSVRSYTVYDYVNDINAGSITIYADTFIGDYLNPLLSVGGLSRVISIDIYAVQVLFSEQSGTTTNYVKVYKKTFTVNHQDFQGSFSAYINPDLLDNTLGNPIYTGTIQDCFAAGYNPATDRREDLFNADIANGFETYPSEAGMSEYFPNGLKVSKTDQPMFFPVENAYQVGSAEILALMSNTIAVGTGQTGAAPLYVFCKDGVYALFVDASGQMTYSNSRVLARYVCNNPRSVTPIDAGVVFTTDRGLMMIAGEQVEEIGQPAEGDVLHYTNVNASGVPLSVEGSKIATDALTKIAGLPSSLCDTTDFLTYLQGAIVNYNHNMRELIVSNPNKGYSYVLDREQNWSRRDYTAAEYVNNFPTSYRLTEDGEFYKLDEEGDDNTSLEHRKEADNQIFYLSNVIKLDSIGFKQAYRFVVRGYFETVDPYYWQEVGRTTITGSKPSPDMLILDATTYAALSVGDVVRIKAGDGIQEVSVSGKYADNLVQFSEALDAYSYSGQFIFIKRFAVDPAPNVGIVVEGSYDGRKFAPLGFNRKSGKFTDIGCHVSHTDVRFYRVILCGQVTGKTRINYMEMSANGSVLNTKIR